MGDASSPSSPASYIRLVQHLIEKCICYNMNREECMETLEKHANIKPVITSTVWKELEKENMEFFEAYKKLGRVRFQAAVRCVATHGRVDLPEQSVPVPPIQASSEDGPRSLRRGAAPQRTTGTSEDRPGEEPTQKNNPPSDEQRPSASHVDKGDD